MPNYLQTQLAHTGTRFKELNPENVVVSFVGGGTGSSAIVMSPILIKSEEITADASIAKVEYQQWACDIADYKRSNGTAMIPTPGDLFTPGDDMDGQTFRVVGRGEAEPPYYYINSNRTRVLINTVLVSI